MFQELHKEQQREEIIALIQKHELSINNIDDLNAKEVEKVFDLLIEKSSFYKERSNFLNLPSLKNMYISLVEDVHFHFPLAKEMVSPTGLFVLYSNLARNGYEHLEKLENVLKFYKPAENAFEVHRENLDNFTLKVKADLLCLIEFFKEN